MPWARSFGNGLLIPRPSFGANAYGPVNVGPVAATPAGQKLSYSGRMWWPADPVTGLTAATKNINSIGFKFGGTVTKSGTTNVRVSLQAYASGGPPPLPSGTPLQSFSVGPTDPNLVPSAWYPNSAMVGLMSPVTFTVSFGQYYCVVFELTASGSTDSIMFHCLPLAASSDVGTIINYYNGTAWTVQVGQPNVAFGFDDGTYGAFDNVEAVPYGSNAGQATVLAANASEVALAFAFPFAVKVDAIGAWVTVAATTSATINLYDTDANLGASLAAITMPIPNAVIALPRGYMVSLNTEVTLQGNPTLDPTKMYRIGLMSSATPGAVTYYWADVPNLGGTDPAALMQCFSLGRGGYFSTRTPGGGTSTTNPWTDTVTRRPLFYMRVSSVHDGLGGGLMVLME